MMIKQRIVRAAMGIALTTASGVAAAESTGWYFGADLGQAKVDLDRAELDEVVADLFISSGFAVLTATTSLDDSDTSWSAFGGYSFSPYFSLEAGYIELGTAKYRASGTVNPPGPVVSTSASYSADFEVSGFTAAAVGSVPIGQMFEAHARAGVLFADLEISETAFVSGFVPDSGRVSSDSRDFFFGLGAGLHFGEQWSVSRLGAGLHFGEQWSVSLDWQQFKDVGDEDETGEADIDRISLGVTYRL
jgi:OOP family OmpA-OmpF porin